MIAIRDLQTVDWDRLLEWRNRPDVANFMYTDHVITEAMELWAHDIRLDANDERHTDKEHVFPNEVKAQKCIDFALALSDFLFVLPARVERGRKAETPSIETPSDEDDIPF